MTESYKAIPNDAQSDSSDETFDEVSLESTTGPIYFATWARATPSNSVAG